MTRRTSYDVQIGGMPYLVVKDEKTGVPAVVLGSSPKEPAQPGGLVTLRVDTLHRGPGGPVDGGAGKYITAIGDTRVPGALWPLGSEATVFYDVADLTATDFRGGTFRDDSAGTIYLYFITPKGVLRYKPSDNTVSKVADPPMNRYFTGARAKFQGKWWLGVEDTLRISGHMVTFQPSTSAWVETAVHGSHVFSAKNKLWWAENKGTPTAPELNWSEAADLSTVVGPYPLDTGGFVTWLHILGPYVLVMKQDGSVYGVDEDGVWVPVVKGNCVAWSDPLFGHGSLEFQGRLLIPGPGQLLCVDSASLAVTDIHPDRIQVGHGYGPNMLGERMPVLARFDDTVVLGAGRSGQTLWILGEYPEGLAWNIYSDGTQGDTILGILQHPVAYNDNRLYLCDVSIAAYPDKTRIRRLYRSSTDHGFSPAALTAGLTSTARLFGEGAAAGATKRFVRVRGWVGGGTWPISIRPDEGTVTSCGSVTAAGPFALDVPTAVAPGRCVRVLITTPTAYEQMAFPLYVDCYAAPAVTDDMTITVLASQEQLHNQGGAWTRRNSKDIYDALSALVSTSTTLLWGSPWNGTTWTVLVLAVEMTELEGPVRTEGQKAIKVYLRRL